jgi:hypothetical protein
MKSRRAGDESACSSSAPKAVQAVSKPDDSNFNGMKFEVV